MAVPISEELRPVSIEDARSIPGFPAAYTRTTWLLLILLVLVAAMYSGIYLKRGWIPHDDGVFGLTAERVMRGELPHRDFTEIYTGGLCFVDAAAFRLFGRNVVSLRYPPYLCFLLWIPAVFAIARRFVSEWVAAAVVLLAIATSFPNYPVAVPSWYNLFFATFGTLAVMRYTETSQRLWLFAAGLCGGISFLFKVSSLYFVAAVLLFLVFHEQDRNQTPDSPRKTSPFSIFVAVGCLMFLVALIKLVSPLPEPRVYLHFVVPGALLVGLLLQREFSVAHVADPQRFRSLLLPATFFLLGVFIPIVIYLAPYLTSASLHAFFEGVFILPTKRFVYVARLPGHVTNLLSSGALAALLCFAIFGKKPVPRFARMAAAIVLGTAVVLAGVYRSVYQVLWNSTDLIIPVSEAVVVWALTRRTIRESIPPLLSQHIFLLASVLGICTIIQFPFGAPVYLLYILPLVPLLWVALASVRPNWSREILGVAAAAYIAFFVLWVTPSYIIVMGISAAPDQQTHRMTLPRAEGLRVRLADQVVYDAAVKLLAEHSQGEYIYAGPDCPEFYFLAGKRVPGSTLFDFFDDPKQLDQNILSALQQHGVTAIALNASPDFSPRMTAALYAELQKRYPYFQDIGHFEIRWSQ